MKGYMMKFINIDNYNIEYPSEYKSTRKPKYTKDDSSFINKEGICYTDIIGNTYSYQDLYDILMNETATEKLYQELCGKSPEETLNDSWLFKKCNRCGNWMTISDSLFSRRKHYCMRCTPLLTKGKIKLNLDPYCDDRKFFRKKSIQFKPNCITTVIGCNGSGKSTLLLEIKEYLRTRGTPYLSFDNLGEEGGEKNSSNMLQSAIGGIKLDNSVCNLEHSVFNFFCASEGEKIREAIITFSSNIISSINKYSGYGEFWILFDALDSGLSVDVIDEIKNELFLRLIQEVSHAIDLYLIVSSNSYEISEETECFSIEKMKYQNIKSYKKFKDLILSSRRYKVTRDHVFEIKSEIYERPYTFNFNENQIDFYNNHHGKLEKSINEDVAEMNCGSDILTLRINMNNNTRSHKFYLNGKSCKVHYDSYDIHINKLEEAMHDYLCDVIFHRENKG